MAGFFQDWFLMHDPHVFADVFEICGGEARCTHILVRRHHFRGGRNFDIVVGINLLKPEEVRMLWTYLERTSGLWGLLAKASKVVRP